MEGSGLGALFLVIFRHLSGRAEEKVQKKNLRIAGLRAEI
jgi:hypothetical protein